MIPRLTPSRSDQISWNRLCRIPKAASSLRAMAIVAESGQIPHPRTGSAGSASASRFPNSTAAALARSARNRLISATLT